MSGLGSVNRDRATYLSIAGGWIWNKKLGPESPDYAEQEYPKQDGEVGVRKGAQYKDLEGTIKAIQFKTHEKFGESINLTIDTVDDERFILAVSTNNKYSTSIMKFLLCGEPTELMILKPYDFIGEDGSKATGVSFKQNGEKLKLRVDEAPSEDQDWWKKASKKDKTRFYEDRNDWYVAEVTEHVLPLYGELEAKAPVKQEIPAIEPLKEDVKEIEVKAEVVEAKVETQAETVEEVSPLKMKKALRAYIKENYEGETLPKLSKEELVVWYNLSLQEEELPFKVEEEPAQGEVPAGDLDDQLENLLGKK
jgi:hypothetical protein